jgi:hypothetical protein
MPSATERQPMSVWNWNWCRLPQVMGCSRAAELNAEYDRNYNAKPVNKEKERKNSVKPENRENERTKRKNRTGSGKEADNTKQQRSALVLCALGP